MKTFSTRPSDVQSQWHVLDAAGRTLGRLATEVSVLLQGKHKPIYARHIITGDYVIVVNASKIRVTGNKLQQKMYRHHSGYPGGLREARMADVLSKYPERIVREAVHGMLPKNTLGRHMLQRLKVYSGESHPHESQVKASAKQDALLVPGEPEVQAVEQPLETTARVAAEDETEE